MSHARLSAPLIALLALLVLAPAAAAKTRPTTVRTSQGTITTTRGTDGVRHMKFRWGPVRIAPGQNTISLDDDNLLPPGPGWITSFKPNLTYVNGRVPRVDVIHLHHAVWIVGRAARPGPPARRRPRCASPRASAGATARRTGGCSTT